MGRRRVGAKENTPRSPGEGQENGKYVIFETSQRISRNFFRKRKSENEKFGLENMIHSSLENQGNKIHPWKSRTHFREPGTNLSLGAKTKPTVLINVHPQQIYK